MRDYRVLTDSHAELEVILGIEHVERCAQYGWRSAFANSEDGWAPASRVKNFTTGHAKLGA